jgi:hypothetical protein
MDLVSRHIQELTNTSYEVPHVSTFPPFRNLVAKVSLSLFDLRKTTHYAHFLISNV